MKGHTFILLLLFVLILGLAFLVGCEYFVLIYQPTWISQLPVSLMIWMDQWMPVMRLALPLCYFLLFTLNVNVLFQKNRPPQQALIRSTPTFFIILRGMILLVSLAGFALILYLPNLTVWWWQYGYPSILLVLGITLPLLAKQLIPQPIWGIRTPRRKQKSLWGFNVRLHNGWINITNPFRGLLLIGTPGSGKTFSFIEPVIEQAIEKGYTGMIYDFKFPNLTEYAYEVLLQHAKDVTCYIINFEDFTRTHRINPLTPANIPNLSYAIEYAQAIIFNLIPESIQRQDFWIRSGTALLSAVIWWLKKHHPQHCSLPHAVALICSKKYETLIKRLTEDPETEGLVASIAVALEGEAGKQIAGVIGTLQNALARINTPEIAWIMADSDFNLQLNDPLDKKFLMIGNDPRLSETLAPAISLIMTVALKCMNQPHRHPSIVVLDEAPTLYLPKLEVIPATARSHQIMTLFAAQDLSQIINMYGKTNADVITSTLSTQIFGKVSHVDTAKYASAMFGKEDKEFTSTHHTSSLNFQKRRSFSVQTRETSLVKPQQIIGLSEGEFVGTVASKQTTWFAGKVKRIPQYTPQPLPPFASNVDLMANFRHIHAEATKILTV